MSRSFLFAAVFFFAALPAAAQPFGSTLTPQEVACEERQLIRLVHRMTEEGSGIETLNLFVWRVAAEGGSYRGVAVSGRSEPGQGKEFEGRSSRLASIYS